MKLIKLYITLALLPLVLTTCKPDEPQYLGEFRLGPEGEAYIKFEPGSYWVYQNDKTGERDSFAMEFYRSEMVHFEGQEREYYREFIEFKWRYNEMGSYYFYNSHPFVDLTPNESWEVSVRNWGFITSPEAASPGTIVFVPLNPKGGGGAVSGLRMQLTKTYDSLKVQGEWFYEVAEFETKPDPLQAGRIGKYYWAKGVGLIKREKYEHWTNEYVEGWHLIKYQVTQ